MLSVLACLWLFVSSPQAITIFVSIFDAIRGPMFDVIVAHDDLVKREQVVLEDRYTMSPNRSLHFESGWNRCALVTLAISSFVSIGLALCGA